MVQKWLRKQLRKQLRKVENNRAYSPSTTPNLPYPLKGVAKQPLFPLLVALPCSHTPSLLVIVRGYGNRVNNLWLCRGAKPLPPLPPPPFRGGLGVPFQHCAFFPMLCNQMVAKHGKKSKANPSLYCETTLPPLGG